MHLIVNGMVATGKTKSPGKLLLSERFIFVLKDTATPASTTAMFGIVGVLITSLIGRANAPKSSPGYLSDPELTDVSNRERHALAGTQLLTKYALSPSLSVTTTKMGYSFNDGSTSTEFSSLINKKKIALFLHEKGVSL